jgi:hypothetical protein
MWLKRTKVNTWQDTIRYKLLDSITLEELIE